MKINRNEVVAVINYKILSATNREFFIEQMKTNKLFGKVSGKIVPDSAIVCKDKTIFTKSSTKYIMKKLNSSLFLKVQEDINERR